MIWTLIGTLMVGVAAACIVFAGTRLSGRPTPRWLLPAVAGAAMLAFNIWSDYAWAERTARELPDHVVVAERYASRSALQPWTYLVPRYDRFSAVDLNEIRRHPQVPEMAMTLVHLVARYYPTLSTLQLYDCETPRRADVDGTLEVDADGRPLDPDWVAVAPDDPVRRLACAQR